MFLLSESELVSSIPLKSISRIEIVFYTSRNESLNIFNFEMDFDENHIPLITSILECKPNLIHRKIYKGLDKDYIVEYDNYNRENQPKLGSQYVRGQYPSFHMDIEEFNKNPNISHRKSYWRTHTLHYSNVYPKSRELVKIYSSVDTKSDAGDIFNPQDSLGCREETVIYWSIPGSSASNNPSIESGCKFELCILSNKKYSNKEHSNKEHSNKEHNNQKCIWRLVVNVIEDNHFIDSKVDAVNTWLEKIHKIKSSITIANQ